MATTHDPIRFVTDLRDHLARHDKPIGFLFGAGTSCAIRALPNDGEESPSPLIPAILPLTAKCREAIGGLDGKYGAAWDAMESESPTGRGHPNVEDILSKVRMKHDAMGSEDTLCGLSRDGMATLEAEITKAISGIMNPPEASFPPQMAHDQLAMWVKKASRTFPLEIFTPNYDLLLERALEKALIPVFDGFVGSYRPFFHADCVEREALMPGNEWVRLWKIHGSINWSMCQSESGLRVFRGPVTDQPVVIMPSHLKYDESRKQPYLALLGRLGRVLDREDSLLVTCGYSFADQHINALIFSVLENRERAHVVALQFDELDNTQPAVKFASKVPRLLVAGPRRAVIGSRMGPWSSDKAQGNASLDEAITYPSEGEVNMLLGDFNAFCMFLDSMAR